MVRERANRLNYDGGMASFLHWLPVIISCVSVTLSLIAFAWQVHRARFTQSIDLLLRFEASFFGPEKREQRAKAAAGMLRQPPEFQEAEDILDFFETIALLSRRRALDRYMVWHTFYYWIDRYYEAAKGHIEERCRREPTVWQDIGPFVASLRKLQQKEAGLSSMEQTIPSVEELESFLQEERSEGKAVPPAASSGRSKLV
jgi:hypothetical protein